MEYPSKLLVKQNKKLFFVPVNKIDWFESSGNYVKIHAGEKSYMIRSSLKALENKLHPRKFLRIHNSIIVNVDSIKEIEPWFTGDYEVTLHTGDKLKMSRNYRDIFERF